MEQTTCSRNIRITALVVGLLALGVGALLLGGIGNTAGWAFLAAGSILTFLSASLKQVRNQLSSQPFMEEPPSSSVLPETIYSQVNNRELEVTTVHDKRGVHKIDINVSQQETNISIVVDFNLMFSDALHCFCNFYDKIDSIKTNRNKLSICVRFHDNNAIDGGGLRRTYMNTLLTGLIHHYSSAFCVVEASGLAIPLVNSPQDLELFKKLGGVIMFCYRQAIAEEDIRQRINTGLRFDQALFQIVFQLSKAEIEAPFLDLDSARKEQLYQILVQRNLYPQHCALLRSSNWSNQEVELAQSVLEAEAFEGDIPTSMEELRPLINGMLSQRLDQILSGIHAFAQGMHAFSTSMWDGVFFGSNPQVFNETVQGVLDREQILQGIGSGSDLSEEVQKKVGWLKEWIGGASPDLLKKFVVYQTASEGWPHGIVVTVQEQRIEFVPFPKVHTCDYAIAFSPEPAIYGEMNDYTYENFVQCLELAITAQTNYSDY